MVENDESSHLQIEQRFVENLRIQREKQGWSQTDLARRMVEAGWANYTQMTVSRTEKLERPLRLSEAHALAELFGETVIKMTAPSAGRALLDEWMLAVDRFETAQTMLYRGARDMVQSRPDVEETTQRIKSLDVSWASPGLRLGFQKYFSATEILLGREPEQVLQRALSDASTNRSEEGGDDEQYPKAT